MSDDDKNKVTNPDDTCKTLTFTVSVSFLGEDCLGVDFDSASWVTSDPMNLEFDYDYDYGLDPDPVVDPNMAYLTSLPEGMPVVILTPQSKLEMEAVRALVYDAGKNSGDANSSWPEKWRTALEQMNTWQAMHGEGGLTPPEID